MSEKLMQMSDEEREEFLFECEMKAAVLEITVDYYLEEFM
jgi:hypothetical protein